MRCLDDFVFMLWQVIQTLTPSLLELPLSLLSRLLLCDPERSVSCLGNAASSFLLAPRDSHSSVSTNTPTRTSMSLLSDLLQSDVLWESSVALLTLLSQVAQCSPQLYLEASVLHQALTHSQDQIRAATCRLLGNIYSFRPCTLPSMNSDIFQHMIKCVHDPSMPVRRMACRAVGSWLGGIAEAGFKSRRRNGKGSGATGWSKVKSISEATLKAGDWVTIVEQGEDFDKDERKWMEATRSCTALLASSLTDEDAVTRRHCCAALGNLVKLDRAVPWLIEEDVPSSVLRAACMDSHQAVRRAAITTLCLYSQHEPIRQVINRL